ncbi:4-hydroxythreonine-4-phosphate dehydrogenase PdxA [Kiritimatiella glycovorans]|uniref:4-hydroxythreonine-4-phosphate dehydrogenase 2 n=1 Tax=Kiritimatiella glycovorans TaxID=1307763 RepID=A0A0G3EBA6_9BACT|nr:4-hydroxythreonine-4-phosphate dehydrogenase PdxA [Kiritimatiella glycovorans]AKJ63776.1 4-hydroxythreonine-4-phosphate dehydrogenase 2 [Kiritimatiella glycovorans]
MNRNPPRRLPRIALTQGDPAGVGPELCLRAATSEQMRRLCRPVIFGDRAVLEGVAAKLDLPAPNHYFALTADLRDEPGEGTTAVDCATLDHLPAAGVVDAECGRAAYASLTAAIEAVRGGAFDALTTAPLSKAALHRAGIHENGHTEILAKKTFTRDYAMMLYSEHLALSFVTCHCALSDVPALCSRERVARVITLTDDALHRIRGRRPRLAVLGLNPHGGEQGAFGREEIEAIAPAIDDAQAAGIDAEGPLPPDAAFMPHHRERYDGWVCQYHDQGHVAFKMVALHEGVNVTLGLPLIRTSVDHGTAFDIARQGRADPGSLFAALRLAAALAADEGREGR